MKTEEQKAKQRLYAAKWRTSRTEEQKQAFKVYHKAYKKMRQTLGFKHRGNRTEQSKRYRAKHHEQIMIRRQVEQAKIHGIIKKPEHCERCPETKMLTCHHNDYNKPLNIIWLCSKCHLIADGRGGS